MSLAEFEIRRLTVDEFMRLAAVGVIGEDERVELIDGELLVMAPQDPEHASCTTRVEHAVRNAFGADYVVRGQMPLHIGTWSLPEPDVAVVPGPMDRWDNAHPTGEDAALVVEIARTKVSRARAKSATYAAGGVREYWIVDVEGRLVEVLTAPDRGQREYRVSRIVRDGEAIELAGQSVAVATLLPARR